MIVLHIPVAITATSWLQQVKACVPIVLIQATKEQLWWKEASEQVEGALCKRTGVDPSSFSLLKQGIKVLFCFVFLLIEAVNNFKDRAAFLMEVCGYLCTWHTVWLVWLASKSSFLAVQYLPALLLILIAICQCMLKRNEEGTKPQHNVLRFTYE